MTPFRSGSRLLVLSVVLGFFAQGIGFAATKTVSIADLAFNPAIVTVKLGDSVTWENLGKGVHTSTSEGHGDDGTGGVALWNSPLLGQGESWSFQFFGGGTFPYYCDRHRSMKGTVKVVPMVAPRTGPTGTTVRVTWADGTPPLDFAYTIQKRNPNGSWQDWQVKTTEETATFKATQAGTYSIRVKMLRVDLFGNILGESRYSPAKGFKAG